MSPKDPVRRDRILIEKDDNDPRMTLGYITQAWTDIRSYSSNIWQVAAVGMAVIVLALNVVVSNATSEKPLPHWMILGIGIFALVFLGITSYSIAWFRRNIAARVEFISKVEERLIEIKGLRLVVSGQDLFSIKQGPLNLLLFTFYSITLVLGEIVVFESGIQVIPFLIPSIESEMIVNSAVIFCILFGVAAILLFARGYYGVRETENRAQIQDNMVVSENLKMLKRGIALEEKMYKKLKEVADKFGYELKMQVGGHDEMGMKIHEIDAVLSSDKFTIPIEAKMRFTTRALRYVGDYLTSLNSNLGVIVTEGDSIDERWMISSDDPKREFHGRIGIIGVDADFDIIQTWIQRTHTK